MASKSVTSNPTSKTQKTEQTAAQKAELLDKAYKELSAACNQLKGLQSYLGAIGQAFEYGGVINLHDLSFGFAYLLDATEDTMERCKAHMEQAQAAAI